MPIRALLKRPDVLIAFALLLASSIVAVAAYAILLESSREKQSLIQQIPTQSVRYKIANGGSCIGSYSHDFIATSEQIEIKGQGELRLKFGAEEIRAEVTVNAGFNTLGQLGGSVLIVKVRGMELRAGTRGIDPIRFRLRFNEDGRDAQRFEVSGPGPILLKRNDVSSYRLEYLHLGQVFSEYQSYADHPILKALQLTFEEEGSASCVEAPTASLDLSTLLLLLPRGTP